MKKRYLVAASLVLLLALAAFAVACGEEATTTTARTGDHRPDRRPPTAPSTDTSTAGEVKTLKMGVITSMTGVMAPGFKAIYDSVKPVQDLINSKGGFKVGASTYNIEIMAYR